jgi:hypothetical protein
MTRASHTIRERIFARRLTVDDLEGTVARLEEQGVEVALAPKTMTVEGQRLPYRVRG